MRCFLRILFFFLPVAVLFFACQNRPHSPQDDRHTLRLNFVYTPFTLDPRCVTEPITATFHAMLYEGLTRLQPDGSIQRTLAKQITVSQDEKTYQFRLKKSYWSDGSLLTAHDFERSWKQALDPQFPTKAAHLFYPIRNAKRAKKGECSVEEVGITAVENDLLVVELTHPTPYFLELVSSCTYFPVPLLQDRWIHNGPFTLTHWRDQAKIELKKNPYFWDAQAVFFDQVAIAIIPDATSALELFHQGQLDWIGGMISPLPPQSVPHLLAEKKAKTHPIALTTFCIFNTGRFPFHNLCFRKALAHAIDQAALIDHITQVPSEMATSLIPPALKRGPQGTFFTLHRNELAHRYLQEGLDQLGLTKEELPPITYTYFQSEIHKNLALALQSMWEEILGIRVRVRGLEIRDHFQRLAQRDFQVAQLSWIAQYLDPMNFLERLCGSNTERNYANWKSPQFRALLEQSAHTKGSARAHILDEAEKILARECPIAPFYHSEMIYAQNPRLKQVEISPLGQVRFHHAYCTPSL